MDNNELCPSYAIQELRDIPPGMLSSPQISTYFKHQFLVKDPALKQLKGATYDMRLGSPAYRFIDGSKEVINLGYKNNSILDIYARLVLPPNSLTFVTTREEFRLTRDVIARFNLKSKWVHKGLLLGTGPIVDPEFEGFLYIPIHNFSSKPVYIEFDAPLIVVEFTKTLDITSGYIDNPSKKGIISNYLESAGDVESSVSSALDSHTKTLQKADQSAEAAMASVNDAKKTIDTVRNISIVASVVAMVAIVIGLYGLQNDVNARIDNIIAFNNQQRAIALEKIVGLEKRIHFLNEALIERQAKIDATSHVSLPLPTTKQESAIEKDPCDGQEPLTGKD